MMVGYSPLLRLMTSRVGSRSAGMVGGFHGMVLLFSGGVSSVSYWVLVFSLKDALEEAAGRLLSSKHCSKAERAPSISQGTSNGQGRCGGVVIPV